MGYINDTDYNYYEGSNLGSYQFVSIDDIVSQFMVVYVGEEKLISNANRTDVQFHAYRALAELSFDTFRSFKAQQIDVPPSLTMRLPKDYVNYTKVSWVDSAGIKHPLYPTKHTSNPYQIAQESDGDYTYSTAIDSFVLSKTNDWIISGRLSDGRTASTHFFTPNEDEVVVKQHFIRRFKLGSYVTYCYKVIDVSEYKGASLKATAVSAAASTLVLDGSESEPVTPSTLANAGTYAQPATTVRVGLSSTPPDIPDASGLINLREIPSPGQPSAPHRDPNYFDLGYIEWTAGETGQKVLGEDEELNFGNLEQAYLVIVCIAPYELSQSDIGTISSVSTNNFVQSTISGISLESVVPSANISSTNEQESSTFTSFKSMTPSENENDDYKNDDYQRVPDERYGLDPAHAQTNGSFYVDQRLGKINFSSNISGKTVILDYISDSLGTDGEMQVHKFAEDAMYKWISYGILSSKANIPEYIVRRAKKEKFAATRQAKLRLSNIKLEEITQTLRGKSKQIKH